MSVPKAPFSYSQFLDPKLFLELSEQEQEAVVGGYNFFIQKTAINTFAINEESVSNGSVSASLKQQTGYNFSQLTIGFDLSNLFGGNTISRMRRYGYSPLNMIYRLLLYLFM